MQPESNKPEWESIIVCPTEQLAKIVQAMIDQYEETIVFSFTEIKFPGVVQGMKIVETENGFDLQGLWFHIDIEKVREIAKLFVQIHEIAWTGVPKNE